MIVDDIILEKSEILDMISFLIVRDIHHLPCSQISHIVLVYTYLMIELSWFSLKF